MLKMKTACERCLIALTNLSEASICSYECTFCKDCTSSLRCICPNCDGDLVTRPKRAVKPHQAAWKQISRKIISMVKKS